MRKNTDQAGFTLINIDKMNLQLSLKRKWFDMTEPDGKTEDYREITPYWCSRLCEYWFPNGDDPLKWVVKFKPFTHNVMTLGYPKRDDLSRIKTFLHEGIKIATGKEEWGAEPNKLYFVIKHGRVK